MRLQTQGLAREVKFFSFEITLETILHLIKETFGSNEKGNESENDYSVKRSKIPFLLLLIVVAITFFIMGQKSQNNISTLSDSKKNIEEIQKENQRQELGINDLLRYNDFQCNYVIISFGREFWKYIAQNKFESPKEFKAKDKRELKFKLWKIIDEGREIFSKIEGMSLVIRELSDIYDYKRFENDFNDLMAINQADNFEDFESEMIEYMREIQRDILNEMRLSKSISLR